jgi:hypothetical protein
MIFSSEMEKIIKNKPRKMRKYFQGDYMNESLEENFVPINSYYLDPY